MDFWCSAVGVRITLSEILVLKIKRAKELLLKGKYSLIGGTSNCGLEGMGSNPNFYPKSSLQI